MKKIIARLALLTMTLTFIPVATAFAAGSPIADILTDEEETTINTGKGGDDDDTPNGPDDDSDNQNTGNNGTDEEGSNKGDKSPQTGNDLAFVYIALIGAAGVALISKKKITE